MDAALKKTKLNSSQLNAFGINAKQKNPGGAKDGKWFSLNPVS